MTVVRYLVAATLARGADAGAAVGFVLLAYSTAQLGRPALTGSLLVACLTAPHLLGPVLARRLDRARDGRRFIALVCALYGLLISAATLGLGRLPLALVAVLTASAGACGPLLTGGLSSRLAALVAPGDKAQRRAQGMDSLSYGIGGTAGPAAVAALVSLVGAETSMLVLAGAAAVAGAMVRTLPAGAEGVPADRVLSVRQALRVIATVGPLRRVMYATMVAAVPGGAIAVIAVALGPGLQVDAGAAGLLIAAFGFGNLAGSLAVTARPLLGEPERLVTVTATLVGLAFGLCALVHTYGLALAAFMLVGALNAPFFTATLASRARYSPPEARAQVFVSMAALKVGAAAAGTAVAGVALGLGPRVLLLIGGAMIILVAAATVLDRRHERPAALLRDVAPKLGSTP
ncbi:MFS transporter [Actinoplanes sp. NPDC026623]|uniref:MFS transporter n=1 Tax=Actinoplanes sp. NPDC026623 TaxID=3155610 RepID=UPI0033D498C2